MNKSMKRIITLITLFVFGFYQTLPVLAQAAPTPPPAPSAPTPPPEVPAAPTPPPAPAHSPQPTSPPTDTTTPDPTPEPTTTPSIEGETQAEATPAPTPTPSSSNPTAITSNGGTGPVTVQSGNATSTATGIVAANSNLSTGSVASPLTNSSGISSNGSGSSSTANTNQTSSAVTTQQNSATVANQASSTAVSGGNEASKNTGGDVVVKSGEANASGTLITAVNSNAAGVAVSEFNVVDDHVGDIILDYGASCIAGCAVFGGDVAISGNGSESSNTASTTNNSTNTTDQLNSATIGNELVLSADSGNNTASKNTGGDVTIETGDANLNANVLTFANANIGGNVLFGTVNIYGDLVGDILLPEEGLSLAGNGNESSNSATLASTTTTSTNQLNIADIGNNLILDNTTGNNQATANTGGNTEIKTGEATVDAQVVNFANLNIVGDVWLVLVNTAGEWIGQIIGGNGTNLATGNLNASYAPDGSVNVTGNGTESTNTSTETSTTSSETNQTNTASIQNNVTMSGNTGGNTASANTGGKTTIRTGDVQVIANLVNFVNANLASGSKLVVTMVNVFGSWVGDFVAPGQKKTVATNPQPTTTPAPNTIASEVDEVTHTEQQSAITRTPSTAVSRTVRVVKRLRLPVVASMKRVVKQAREPQVMGVSTADEGETTPDGAILTTASQRPHRNKVSVNLAYALFLVPPALFGLYLKRRMM